LSTAINARFYFRQQESPSPVEALCKMARTFAEWPQAAGIWQAFKMLRDNWHTVAARLEGPLSTDELCAAAAKHRGTHELLSATTSFRCWRFDEQGSKPGSVASGLQSWDEAWCIQNHEDRRIGGGAALSIFQVGPFCALDEMAEPASARHDAVNSHVRENLDALTGLLFRLIEALEPYSVKVFTDQGLYLPLNAHLAYYRDGHGVLDDLSLIAHVWEHGLPAHRIAPLKHHQADDMGPFFHGWRRESQREQLWSRLNALLPPRVSPSIETVRAVLSSGTVDTYSMPVGTTLLHYPDFMNSFLDAFYVEILSKAASVERVT
jgi:hypothetical protein